MGKGYMSSSPFHVEAGWLNEYRIKKEERDEYINDTSSKIAKNTNKKIKPEKNKNKAKKPQQNIENIHNGIQYNNRVHMLLANHYFGVFNNKNDSFKWNVRCLKKIDFKKVGQWDFYQRTIDECFCKIIEISSLDIEDEQYKFKYDELLNSVNITIEFLSKSTGLGKSNADSNDIEYILDKISILKRDEIQFFIEECVALKFKKWYEKKMHNIFNSKI